MVKNQPRDYSVKQISIQIADETARQIAELARMWGLPTKRNNTSVIERVVERVYQQEMNKREQEKREERQE